MTNMETSNARRIPRPGAVDFDRLRPLFAPLALGIVLVGAWQTAAVSETLPETLPPPSELVEYVRGALMSSKYWGAIAATMLSWAIGFSMSVVSGGAVGVVAGLSRKFDALIQPLVEFLRPIPAVVYLPLVVLVLGTGHQAVAFLVMAAAVWPVLLQTIAGVRDADPVLLDMGRAFGLSRCERIRWCIIPGTAPFVATGVRISATISLVVVISVELLATGTGLGGVIAVSYQTGSYATLFGTGLVVALIGVAMDQGLGVVERRVLHWHASQRIGVGL